MAESLSSAELLRQLKSLGMERLLHVVNAFLRQSYTYPPLLTFGGKTSFVFLVDAYGKEVSCSSTQEAASWLCGDPGPSGQPVCGRLIAGMGLSQGVVEQFFFCRLSHLM